MKTNLVATILEQKQRLAMLVGAYPGLELTGKTVWQAVHDPLVQLEAQEALNDRYGSLFFQTAMDLSIEAETFGAQVRFEQDDIPTIEGRLVTDRRDLQALIDPKPGHKRTTVPLSTVRLLKERARGRSNFVLGGMIGPFSLASRLYGVSEALMLTAQDPELMTALVEAATRFLVRYANAFKLNEADGIFLAEPTAGLVSPKAMARFSMPYVRQIVESVQSETFTVIYHNCGAKLVHLPVVLEDGAAIHHFGKLMDLPAALGQVGRDVVLAGNLDPAGTFYDSSPAEVYRQSSDLLTQTAAYPNFLLSSGCDLPPGTPLANLDAFYKALGDFNKTRAS